jgi:hypothetical protein
MYFKGHRRPKTGMKMGFRVCAVINKEAARIIADALNKMDDS